MKTDTQETPNAPVPQITLTMSAMQWTEEKDIDDVDPLNEKDYACLAEIREVLKKHNKRERFGVALIHKHFDMAEDEVLLEQTNKHERTLTLKPAKRDAIGKTVETVWKLVDGDLKTMSICQRTCLPNGVHGHSTEHHSGPYG